MASKNVSKEDAGLQAVVIADNFHTSALPLGTSWALLPLAGARIIDYTIEFLLQTAVDEVIIYSVVQSKQVEQYVRERWITSGLVSFRVTFLSSQSSRSFGDALRDIDSKALIKSDFLLTQAGFVSNFDIGSALATFKSRRVKDKNVVLTLIYSESSINHSARYRNSDALLVLDTVTNRLLHYQQFTNTVQDFEYPVDVLTLNDEVTTRFDLLDCHMAICSPQIPVLFSDNFDFQTRQHLIREILTNEEVLAYRVFAHITDGKFSAFIGDYNTYIAISQSILERWCFPIVPDSLNGTLTRYSWRWPNIYVADGVKRIAKSARIQRNVLIGVNCEISENCELVNVVMGDNCVIGANSVLKNCVLWNNVVLEPNCVVENSILCEKSRLGAKTRLSERSILGNEVVVPSSIDVSAGTTLCKNRASQDADIISEPAGFATKMFRWRLSESDEATEIWPSFVRLDLAEVLDISGNGILSPGSSVSGDELLNPNDVQLEQVYDGVSADYESFSQEVLDSLQRGYLENVACDNLIMEINSSKHAYNVPVAELQRRIMTAILATALEQNRIQIETTADLIKVYKLVLAKFLPLINNYFKPKKNSSTTFVETQSHCLAAIEDFATTKERFAPALSQVMYFLYDKEILEEGVLLPWCNRLPETLKSQLQSFIQWLEEAEEESSDESD